MQAPTFFKAADILGIFPWSRAFPAITLQPAQPLLYLYEIKTDIVIHFATTHLLRWPL